MPVYFQFESTDAQVTDAQYGLSGTEIAAVTVWQDTSLDYDFSFHSSHESGHPIYICKSSDHGQRNMPKIDLKGKTATGLSMVNAKKLTKNQKEDANAVVAANLTEFQKMARLYYDGAPTVTTAPVVTAPATVYCRHCNRDITRVQPNTWGKVFCPGCKKQQ